MTAVQDAFVDLIKSCPLVCGPVWKPLQIVSQQPSDYSCMSGTTVILCCGKYSLFWKYFCIKLCSICYSTNLL